jgi:hypothetical protein
MSRDAGDANSALMFRGLPIGARVQLRDGRVGSVTGNPGDGAWLFVDIVDPADGPQAIDRSAMVFCTEIVGLAP